MGESVWVISHWDLVIRLVVAVFLGGLVGIEREWSNHAAGFRTHILVCLGSATIMLLSIHGFSQFVDEFNVRVDPSRLAAQVVSGIGFLGAGAILRNGNIITGLTTAASIWVVAAIGLCVGAGFFIAAGSCTVLVLISLLLLNRWEKHVLRKNKNHEVEIQTVSNSKVLSEMVTIFMKQEVQVTNLNMVTNAAQDDEHSETMSFFFSLKSKKTENLLSVLSQIANMDTVISIDSKHFVATKNSGAANGSLTI